MAENSRKPELLLRVATLKGIVYEKYIDYVRVSRSDGFMVINRNYSPTLERLADGEIVVHEQSAKVVISLVDGWLTVSNNICHIYGAEANIVSS